MAKMGRPKAEATADKRITVRFMDDEYNLLLEYAKNHEMSIAQVIRKAVDDLISTDQK